MAFTRDYDTSTPIDHTLVSQLPAKDRSIKVDVADRLATIISGFASGETVLGVLNFPFIAQGSDPSTVTDQIQLYAKVVSTKTELFTKNEDGTVTQITSGGALNTTDDVKLTGDQTVAGIKTFSSLPVLPATSPSGNQAVSKTVLDAAIASIPAQVGFGEYVTKSASTSYQAATDGFITADGEASSTADMQIDIYSDASNPPTTIIRTVKLGNSSGNNVIAVCEPIKKNKYYRVVFTNCSSRNSIKFTPLGS